MIKEMIASSLNINIATINNVVTNNGRYKIYLIGKRIIKQPSKELKTLQYWLNYNIFKKYFPCSSIATAYEKGNSIKKNAKIHKNNKYILHLDIKNFFPSITPKMLSALLNNGCINMSEEDVQFILCAVLYRSIELTVGSVSAPILANRILYNFDQELISYLNAFFGPKSYAVTRYADDILISCNSKIDERIIPLVSTLLKKYGFVLNDKKTYFMYSGGKRYITGVCIDNNTNELTVGTKKYREIKKLIYSYLITEFTDKDVAEKERQRVIGNLAFLKDISPKQYLQLKRIYTRYQKNDKILFK